MSLEEHDLVNHRPFLTTEPVAQHLATARSPLPTHKRVPHSGRRNRHSPYPQPQHSLYQLNITYLVSSQPKQPPYQLTPYHKDPATVEELIEIVRPRSPRNALAAVLEPPPRGLHDQVLAMNGEVERRPVNWMFAMIMDFVEAMKQAIRGV